MWHVPRPIERHMARRQNGDAVRQVSSLAARKTLAKELNYTGDTKDSATMSRWLHRQVMAKLAQNGGKLPDHLKPETKH